MQQNSSESLAGVDLDRSSVRAVRLAAMTGARGASAAPLVYLRLSADFRIASGTVSLGTVAGLCRVARAFSVTCATAVDL